MTGGGWLKLSTLQHFAYCPTQASLLVDGDWSDSTHTLRGDAAHERVDALGTDNRRGTRVHHRVALANHRLKIEGIADAIEEDGEGQLVPVEYKLGRGAGELFPTTAQVIAQAMCIEEMTGAKVQTAAIYVVSERRRESLVVDQYRGQVESLIDRARSYLALAPQPAPTYSARLCRSCSVRDVCQPRGPA